VYRRPDSAARSVIAPSVLPRAIIGTVIADRVGAGVYLRAPAVGKLTVGLELAALTGFKVLHNHLTVCPLVAIFERSSPPYSRLLREFRVRMLEEAADAGIDLIATWAYPRDAEEGRGRTSRRSSRGADASMYFDLLTVFLFGLIWIGIVTFLRLKKKKSLVYLIFFTIFYVYLFKVLDYTLFQFQSLLLLKYFMPNLILKGQTAGESINTIPLITLMPQDLKTSLLNILLLIPFGFGLPFITNLHMKKIVVIGMFLSIVIEFLQLVTGFMTKITFRVADINDVIFNTVGVAIGYILFVGFVRIYCNISHNCEISANPILRYIAERPQITKQAR
jgi:glycopeptide antibiotics resistance protein